MLAGCFYTQWRGCAVPARARYVYVWDVTAPRPARHAGTSTSAIRAPGAGPRRAPGSNLGRKPAVFRSALGGKVRVYGLCMDGFCLVYTTYKPSPSVTVSGSVEDGFELRRMYIRVIKFTFKPILFTHATANTIMMWILGGLKGHF